MTPSELQTFADHMAANTDQTVIDALADGSNNVLLGWYNQTAVPDYWIYRATVPTSDVRDSINMQNLADITAADLDRVEAMLNIRSERGFDGSDDSDRSAWDDVFSAAAGDESQQAIALLWARIALNVETVFKTSTGTGADRANADTTTFQGSASIQDVRGAVALIGA